MESLSETPWDVVISGTGLQQSLLALALSRSDKKVLHVDQNDYYGGPDAAFSLQEAEEWVDTVTKEDPKSPFSKASFFKADDAEGVKDSEKLSFSRAYTLTLSPQIIYSRSKLLTHLVASKVYKQLEFQAVGNWWLFDGSDSGTLKRIPNGREDIFSDRSIDVRAKRALMNFVKFVVDYEDYPDVWEPFADAPLLDFLSTEFHLPASLQTMILALTLSTDIPTQVTVKYALPRIERHLTSIGIFGPGFGSVFPKWGGGSEIAQVACRAGAVGGGVYMLGAGIAKLDTKTTGVDVTLTNDEVVHTQLVVDSQDLSVKASTPTKLVAKSISIISSDLASLFTSTVEGAPTAAVSIFAFPSNTLVVDGNSQQQPVYIMAHSSDTGECPVGQCVLYATTLVSANSKALLDIAVSSLLVAHGKIPDAENAEESPRVPRVLYSLYYEQAQTSTSSADSLHVLSLPSPSLDLAFDDDVLETVEGAWKKVMGTRDGGADAGPFLAFQEREGMGPNDEDE